MKALLQTLAALLLLGMAGLIIYFINGKNISPSALLDLPDEIKRPDIGMSFSGIRLVQKTGNRTIVDLRAASGFINQESNTVNLFFLEGDMKSNNGQPVRVKSQQGKYLKETGTLILSGEILATIDKRVKLKTQKLRWSDEKRMLTSDDFVTITNVAENFRLTGIGLEYAPDDEEFTLKKDVSAIFFNIP